jgi:hypothetical protein
VDGFDGAAGFWLNPREGGMMKAFGKMMSEVVAEGRYCHVHRFNVTAEKKK